MSYGPNRTRAHQHRVAKSILLTSSKRVPNPKSIVITHVHAFAEEGHEHGKAPCQRQECSPYEQHGEH